MKSERVTIPKNTASVALHTSVAGARFNQLKFNPGGSMTAYLNFLPNSAVAIVKDCTMVEVLCDGPCELEWFP